MGVVLCPVRIQTNIIIVELVPLDIFVMQHNVFLYAGLCCVMYVLRRGSEYAKLKTYR